MKKEIQTRLIEAGIKAAKISISKNRIDVKYEKDFSIAKRLFPSMTISYGFIN